MKITGNKNNADIQKDRESENRIKLAPNPALVYRPLCQAYGGGPDR
jgi:hypothetical protein